MSWRDRKAPGNKRGNDVDLLVPAMRRHHLWNCRICLCVFRSQQAIRRKLGVHDICRWDRSISDRVLLVESHGYPSRTKTNGHHNGVARSVGRRSRRAPRTSCDQEDRDAERDLKYAISSLRSAGSPSPTSGRLPHPGPAIRVAQQGISGIGDDDALLLSPPYSLVRHHSAGFVRESGRDVARDGHGDARVAVVHESGQWGGLTPTRRAR
jgi:hypothetical protein